MACGHGTQQPAVLFPSHELTTANPLARGALVRLPGKTREGEAEDWQVNREASGEEITVVVARRQDVLAVVGDPRLALHE